MKEEIIRIDLDGVNCYLAKYNDSFVLFDAGGPLFMDKQFNDRQHQLVAALDKAGCNQDNLKLLILTHGDLDHIYNAAYIRERYNLSIAIHKNDLLSVENPSVQTVFANCQYRSGLYKLANKAIKIFMKKSIVEQLSKFQHFTPDILIGNNFDLKKYGLKASIYHLPGHTPGSIGVLFESGAFICGDTFSNQAKPAIAPNAYDFTKLDESVENLKRFTIDTVYPGHGSPFTLLYYSP